MKVGQRKAATVAVPAPVGGLNTRDALADMPTTDASVMENLIPFGDRVETRPGFSVFSTATAIVGGTATEGFAQLIAYGTSLFAVYPWKELVGGVAKAGRCRIYSVNTTSGALSTSREVTAIGSGNTAGSVGAHTIFATAAGTRYIILPVAINGVFSPQGYDGATWSTLSVTGATAPMGCHPHRNRLWFYNDSAKPLSGFYLGTGAVSGALTEFNMAPYLNKGGTIIAMETWALEGGEENADELAVFITDQGQAIVYSGTDPASLATWSLQGVFDLGIVGQYNGAATNNVFDGEFPAYIPNAYSLKYGADVLFAMTAGVVSANRVLRGAPAGEDTTLSSKIRNAITTTANTFNDGTQFGILTIPPWKLYFASAARLLFLSIPTSVVSPSISYQQTVTTVYVMNTETGAWTKFTGLNVRDMVSIGTTIYFVDGASHIYKYGGAATDDNGTAITYECRGAYSYLNSPNNTLVTLMQPSLRATGNFSMTVQADADFNAGTISSYSSYTISVAQNLQPWISPGRYGRAIAPHIKGQTSSGVVSWYATNWAFQPGGIV